MPSRFGPLHWGQSSSGRFETTMGRDRIRLAAARPAIECRVACVMGQAPPRIGVLDACREVPVGPPLRAVPAVCVGLSVSVRGVRRIRVHGFEILTLLISTRVTGASPLTG